METSSGVFRVSKRVEFSEATAGGATGVDINATTQDATDAKTPPASAAADKAGAGTAEQGAVVTGKGATTGATVRAELIEKMAADVVKHCLAACLAAGLDAAW